MNMHFLPAGISFNHLQQLICVAAEATDYFIGRRGAYPSHSLAQALFITKIILKPNKYLSPLVPTMPLTM